MSEQVFELVGPAQAQSFFLLLVGGWDDGSGGDHGGRSECQGFMFIYKPL